MAVTSTNMSLRIWNLLNDPFDHAQLATNWDKVDQHDHTSGRGVQIPTAGLADGSVSITKLAAEANPLPALNARKVLYERHGIVTTTGVWPLDHGGVASAIGTAATWGAVFWLDPADWPSGSHTTQISLDGGLALNTVSPGVAFTYTVELRAATVNGNGTNAPLITPGGTVIAASQTFTGPAVSSAYHLAPISSVAFPAAGWYCLVANVTGSGWPTNAQIAMRGSLKVAVV
jgi:hypothetical protein